MENKEIKKLLDDRYNDIQCNPEKFISADPIQFPRRYTHFYDIIISAFCTAFISLGNRKEILKKAEEIDKMFREAGSPRKYIFDQMYIGFKGNQSSFYRMLKKDDFYSLCEILRRIHLKGFNYYVSDFYKHDGSGFVFGKECTVNKRFHMAMRWLVRKDAVDIGILNHNRYSTNLEIPGILNHIDPKRLLIPVDTHVQHVARTLWPDLPKTLNYKFVMALTSKLRELDSDDPIKYDLALFSLGEDKTI